MDVIDADGHIVEKESDMCRIVGDGIHNFGVREVTDAKYLKLSVSMPWLRLSDPVA